MTIDMPEHRLPNQLCEFTQRAKFFDKRPENQDLSQIDVSNRNLHAEQTNLNPISPIPS
jgi:hypothetical protein